MANNSLHTKYRPGTFEEIVGHRAIVDSLKKTLKAHQAHCFLFTGPSGTGKTTLARIVAMELGCRLVDNSLIEVPAAVFNGVDDMRRILDTLNYRPFGAEAKAIVLDECHALSKQAWQSVLKATEEPPDWVYWFLCTTDPARVPDTIITRFLNFKLGDVAEKDIRRLVEDIADEETIEIGEGAIDLVVREARGSPRRALVNLEQCRGIKTKADAAKRLNTQIETDATSELCRFLMKPGSWAKAMSLVDKVDEDESLSPEGVRIVIRNYFGKVVRGAKDDKAACFLLGVLDAFSTPYNPSEGVAPLMSSIGQVIFGQGVEPDAD